MKGSTVITTLLAQLLHSSCGVVTAGVAQPTQQSMPGVQSAIANRQSPIHSAFRNPHSAIDTPQSSRALVRSGPAPDQSFGLRLRRLAGRAASGDARSQRQESLFLVQLHCVGLAGTLHPGVRQRPIGLSQARLDVFRLAGRLLQRDAVMPRATGPGHRPAQPAHREMQPSHRGGSGRQAGSNNRTTSWSSGGGGTSNWHDWLTRLPARTSVSG